MLPGLKSLTNPVKSQYRRCLAASNGNFCFGILSVVADSSAAAAKVSSMISGDQ
jgi:hypothetical protein